MTRFKREALQRKDLNKVIDMDAMMVECHPSPLTSSLARIPPPNLVELKYRSNKSVKMEKILNVK